MPGLAQGVLDHRFFAAAFADQPADIEPGQIHHRERPHRQSEFDQCRLDLLRQRPFEQQPFGLDRAARQHPVADKAIADADHRWDLAELPGQRQGGRHGIGCALRPADDLQQAHNIGRAEKMGADHIPRPGRGPGDRVDVEGRGVGGEQCALFRHPVEIGEDALLQTHVLEHRLDHDIGLACRVEPDGAGDKTHAPFHRVGAEPAARDRRAIIGGDPVEPLAQQIVAGLDQGHRNPGIGKAHGDAAAHRAGPDHGGAGDRARLYVRRNIGHLCRLALGEEDMPLRL